MGQDLCHGPSSRALWFWWGLFYGCRVDICSWHVLGAQYQGPMVGFMIVDVGLHEAAKNAVSRSRGEYYYVQTCEHALWTRSTHNDMTDSMHWMQRSACIKACRHGSIHPEIHPPSIHPSIYPSMQERLLHVEYDLRVIRPEAMQLELLRVWGFRGLRRQRLKVGGMTSERSYRLDRISLAALHSSHSYFLKEGTEGLSHLAWQMCSCKKFGGVSALHEFLVQPSLYALSPSVVRINTTGMSCLHYTG